MCLRELCLCFRPDRDHGEETNDIPPRRSKTTGGGEASQSVTEASGSHEKFMSTQSMLPNKGDPSQKKPDVKVDAISRPIRPNHGDRSPMTAEDAARTPNGEFSARDQTRTRNNYSAADDGAKKDEKVPKKKSISSWGGYWGD